MLLTRRFWLSQAIVRPLPAVGVVKPEAPPRRSRTKTTKRKS